MNTPSIYHLWADFHQATDPASVHRLHDIHATWGVVYGEGPWVPLRYPRAACERTTKDFGDTTELPFVRDMVDYALSWSKTEADVIVLTTSTICFVPGMTKTLLQAVAEKGAAMCFRWKRNLTKGVAHGGTVMPQRDLFAFTAEWWKSHSPSVPDMVMECKGWDNVLGSLMFHCGGAVLSMLTYVDVTEEKPLFQTASMRHNTKLLAAFMESHRTPKSLTPKIAFSPFRGNTVRMNPAL
jgi:hypothetical protein